MNSIILSFGGDIVTKLGLLVYLKVNHTSMTAMTLDGTGSQWDFEIPPDFDFAFAGAFVFLKNILLLILNDV